MMIYGQGVWEPMEECHHIFSGQNRRPDNRSNLIGLNSDAHFERHHGTKGIQNDITVLCLMAKRVKSIKIGNALEFHYDDLRNSCGHNLLPIIEGVRFRDAGLEEMRGRLEDIIRTLESE